MENFSKFSFISPALKKPTIWIRIENSGFCPLLNRIPIDLSRQQSTKNNNRTDI